MRQILCSEAWPNLRVQCSMFSNKPTILVNPARRRPIMLFGTVETKMLEQLAYTDNE